MATKKRFKGLATGELVPEHAIDTERTKVHDYDRLGDFYSAWCVCGAHIAHKLPHYGKGQRCRESCRDTVEDALDLHVARVGG